MKTLIKSGGGFMKPILMAGAVVMLGLGATGAALADNAVELVSGNDIIYWDGATSTLTCTITGVGGSTSTGIGSTVCNTFGVNTPTATPAAGAVTDAIAASTFNGWNISDSGTSYAPDCTGGTCEDQIALTAVNSGGALGPVAAYFAASAFAVDPTSLGFTAAGTEKNTLGTATAMAYAYNGALGLSGTAAPVGLPGPFDTITLAKGEGFQSDGPLTAAGSTLAAEFLLTTGSTPGEYSVTETITGTPVPESSAVSVFLVMLLGIAFVARRGIAFNRM
jgi:hypothetical protein